jgi:hypothetical protein
MLSSATTSRTTSVRALPRVSGGGTQCSQSQGDESANRSLGRQAAGGCEGVEAVVRELVSRDVVVKVAALCSLDQQVADEVVQVLPCSGDMVTAMKEGRQFGAVVLMLDERVGLEHSGKLLASVFRAGWNAKQVQLVLGHHSPAFTLSTYVHLIADDLPDATFLDALTAPRGDNAGDNTRGRTSRGQKMPRPRL